MAICWPCCTGGTCSTTAVPTTTYDETYGDGAWSSAAGVIYYDGDGDPDGVYLYRIAIGATATRTTLKSEVSILGTGDDAGGLIYRSPDDEDVRWGIEGGNWVLTYPGGSTNAGAATGVRTATLRLRDNEDGTTAVTATGGGYTVSATATFDLTREGDFTSRLGVYAPGPSDCFVTIDCLSVECDGLPIVIPYTCTGNPGIPTCWDTYYVGSGNLVYEGEYGGVHSWASEARARQLIDCAERTVPAFRMSVDPGSCDVRLGYYYYSGADGGTFESHIYPLNTGLDCAGTTFYSSDTMPLGSEGSTFVTGEPSGGDCLSFSNFKASHCGPYRTCVDCEEPTVETAWLLEAYEADPGSVNGCRYYEDQWEGPDLPHDQFCPSQPGWYDGPAYYVRIGSTYEGELPYIAGLGQCPDAYLTGGLCVWLRCGWLFWGCDVYRSPYGIPECGPVPYVTGLGWGTSAIYWDGDPTYFWLDFYRTIDGNFSTYATVVECDLVARFRAPITQWCGPTATFERVDGEGINPSAFPSTISATRAEPSRDCYTRVGGCSPEIAGDPLVLEGLLDGTAYKVCMYAAQILDPSSVLNGDYEWTGVLEDHACSPLTFSVLCIEDPEDTWTRTLRVDDGTTVVDLPITILNQLPLAGEVGGTLTGICGDAAIDGALSACDAASLPPYPCCPDDVQHLRCCLEIPSLYTYHEYTYEVPTSGGYMTETVEVSGSLDWNGTAWVGDITWTTDGNGCGGSPWSVVWAASIGCGYTLSDGLGGSWGSVDDTCPPVSIVFNDVDNPTRCGLVAVERHNLTFSTTPPGSPLGFMSVPESPAPAPAPREPRRPQLRQIGPRRQLPARKGCGCRGKKKSDA